MPGAEVLPLTARANAANHLEVGGCDVTALAVEHGTPLYIFDQETIEELATRARSAFESRWPACRVLYATKAYWAPFLARLYQESGLGLDVTSEIELEIARRAKFDPDLIYLHGNNKSSAEIHTAFSLGVSHLVIDNLDEIPVIASIARGFPQTPRLLMRLAPDIHPHTHRYLATGSSVTKFGLRIKCGEADRAFDLIRQMGLELAGLHVHIGSQVFEGDAYVEALDCALDVAQGWNARLGFQLQELDIGGGWGVGYSEDRLSLDLHILAERITTALHAGLEARSLSSQVRLLVEPGRALIARAAVAVYRVGSFKTISNACTYASVDGGMGDNIRPALYGATYSAFAANRFGEPATRQYAIAGRYCEQGDVLVDSVWLPSLSVGDLLAIPCAGAYQLPLSSNYNLIPRPAVVLVKDGRAQLVRRRENIDDLLACDLGS